MRVRALNKSILIRDALEAIKEIYLGKNESICMGKERVKNPVHPTQKPIKVLSPLIRLATNPSDLVFDPFMGVGSTGVAALQLNRRFLGIEIDPAYFKAAEKRIQAVTPELFTPQTIDKGSVTDEDFFKGEPTLFASNEGLVVNSEKEYRL